MAPRPRCQRLIVNECDGDFIFFLFLVRLQKSLGACCPMSIHNTSTYCYGYFSVSLSLHYHGHLSTYHQSSSSSLIAVNYYHQSLLLPPPPLPTTTKTKSSSSSSCCSCRNIVESSRGNGEENRTISTKKINITRLPFHHHHTHTERERERETLNEKNDVIVFFYQRKIQ